jgi:hypothetical protein
MVSKVVGTVPPLTPPKIGGELEIIPRILAMEKNCKKTPPPSC